MPRLTINLGKIEQNSRLIAQLLAPHEVRLIGVTKACRGHELVAEAMLSGGAVALADSRAGNIRNLRRNFPETEIEFLRSPVSADDVGFDADIYFVSSVKQAESLLKMTPNGPLKFCLLIETGDGREGVPLDQASEEAARLNHMEEVLLVGLATNTACARSDLPVGDALERFNDVAGKITWRLGRGHMRIAGEQAMPGDKSAGSEESSLLPVLSVGGSGLLRLLVSPEETAEKKPGWGMSLFARVTELRCGEAILLGRIPAGPTPDLYLQGAHRDAFILEGPVIEVYEKNGVIQALVGFGVQDMGGAPLIPCHPGITPASATSDYFAVTCASPELRANPLQIGEMVSFIPTYYALLAAMTSPFVEKNFV